MRRLLSILLLVAFGFPLASPLLALSESTAARLPACCRRDGKHHCMTMAAREQTPATSTQASAPLEKCPYAPGAVASVHPSVLATAELIAVPFAPVLSHPSGVVQTESKRRISRDRSRQKRGPPVLLTL